VAGFVPREVLRCAGVGKGAELSRGAKVVRKWGDELEAIAWLEEDARERRWTGCFGYDLGRAFERLPVRAANDLEMPAFVFGRGEGGVREEEQAGRAGGIGIRSTFRREEYLEAARRTVEYIRAGDVFQVNLSQRFTAELAEEPWEIYQRMRERTPARYGGFLDFGDHVLMCNSPELFLKVIPLPDGMRRILTRPIKGTRPRGEGMREELFLSEKDRAELNMIVDLERNDLGRVCEVGSVRVSEPRGIEEHPTVYHGVATIEGRLREEVGLVDLLRATFPGGSITGAPKIRAMEIIEELEPTRRGAYCGAIGWIGPGGQMELNVAIRTMTAKGGLVHMPVGGGIVADSMPEDEYEETLVKARAMFEAVGVKI
jgi:para-aminobenzoate synthetase component 1